MRGKVKRQQTLIYYRLNKEVHMEISEVKKAIISEQGVKFKGISYYTTGCTMRLINNKWMYYLELHDMVANAVVIAPINEVST